MVYAGRGLASVNGYDTEPARYPALTETIASGGGSRPNDDVQAVTGAPPTSFTEFARRTASAWAVRVAE
jgi:hypothetical protein